MVSFKKFLTLVFIGVAGALPAADSNGRQSDLVLDKRNLLDSRAVRSTSTRVTATTTFLIGVTTVRTTTFLVTVTTATKTDLTTVTLTSTALVTDVTTKTLTNTATSRVANTKAVQVAVTNVEQVTQRITTGTTTIVTIDVDTTLTTDVTDASTVDVLTTSSTTVSTLVTAPTPTVLLADVHCNVVGYGDDTNYWSGGSGRSIGNPSFSVCRDFCLSDSEAASFSFNSEECDCYNSTVSAVVTPDTSSPWTFYDLLCGSANKPSPSKRAVNTVQIPDYLPSKAPSDVSSACSCLIASPSAPTTTTFTAKASRTITTTQTKTNTFSVNKLKSTFVTDRKTSTSTSSTKTTKTGSQTVTQTSRKSATITKPVTVTVTNFNTVVVTNTNVVDATSYNTVYVTNVNTVAETDYNTVVVTNAEGFMVTQYYTTVQTDVATSVITPDLKQTGARILILDFLDESSIKSAVEHYGRGPLDVLVNCAGIGPEPDDWHQHTADILMEKFRTNTVQAQGPFLTTKYFHPNLKLTSGRVYNLSSRGASISNNIQGQDLAYRLSKTALSQLTATMAAEFKNNGDGIAVIAVYPGYVATRLPSFRSRDNMEECIEGVVRVIETTGMSETGSFVDWKGQKMPW
ncbi:hypothetical protein FPHYL_12427 [Fusarium phyllophilum]|uniref:Uncharacterized protein n=1 Tax=Fusarium phyllophilum TaxID=47803 RepID=A0A8H5MS98_9HYPO|nr:hypothetical protein FPHYL_12427 [Fusarium phyllophilum]